jgi:hypothetical protein
MAAGRGGTGAAAVSQGRKPYDPHMNGPQVHDRRARQTNRGQAGHIVEVEVEDPYDPATRISAVRSTRDDPLAWHRSRNHIDQAQYEAGRAFQKAFAEAERGPTAIPLAEAVDGNPPRETLTDGQLKAGKWLTKCYGALGRDGSILMHDMLVHNRTTKQIAASRGMVGSAWEQYFARRLWECLNTLAVVFGFSNGTTP